MNNVPQIDSSVIMNIIPYFITVAVLVAYLSVTKSGLRFSYKTCFKHGKCSLFIITRALQVLAY